ncbi:unnamed protein product [Allacma fusca]|uniref:Uncharacterized protein n=1 Tax=Allacma fusca TaxID=39272 RepID=A0A8J2KGG1_9HEXA|nr:unnamed protein product [Allacma fusca]
MPGLDATMRSDDFLSSGSLLESEWKIVEQMITFLEPFSKMTDNASKQHVPVMSLTAGDKGIPFLRCKSSKISL